MKVNVVFSVAIEAKPNGGGNKAYGTQKIYRHRETIKPNCCFMDTVHDS